MSIVAVMTEGTLFIAPQATTSFLTLRSALTAFLFMSLSSHCLSSVALSDPAQEPGAEPQGLPRAQVR